MVESLLTPGKELKASEPSVPLPENRFCERPACLNFANEVDLMTSMKNYVRITVTAVAFLFCFSIQVKTQVAGGTISGTVTDQSGLVVPQAQVKLLHKETGIVREMTTNGEGFYTAVNLPAGEYQITASASGFETRIESGVQVGVGAELVDNLSLVVGATTEKVEVSADAAPVDLGSSTMSNTVNGTAVRELPLNGRDWTQLAALQPGVSALTTQPALSIGNERANRGWGTQLTIGGNRPQQNNYRLDGVSINDYSNGAPGSTLGVVLGVDAIREFSVQTNNASASYGRSSGGVVNAITRSGTNEFHAGAYEFSRNSALDARNFFDGAQIPPFSRNQFGADAGGPIAKNHTFIFGDYEGLRQTLGVTQSNLIVPSPAAAAVADPRVKPFLSLYPLPNGAVSGLTGFYSQAIQQVTREDFFTVRVDHTVSPKDFLYGTYFFDDGNTTAPDTFSDTLTADLTRRQGVILEETHTFSPMLVNSIRFGFSRVSSEAPKIVKVLNPAAADLSLGFNPGRAVGSIAVTGLQTFPGGVGSAGEYDFHYNSFQAYDDGYLTKGTHGFRFGAAFERIQQNQIGNASPNGAFTFGSVANFLADRPGTYTSAIGGAATPRDLRSTIIGGYFHDDWRAFSNLTLNLGVRYEMSTVPTETAGKLSNLPSLTSPTPKLGSPYFANPTKRNFEPRVGFAWDPFRSGKTSVRGAFGMYDNLPLPYLYLLLSVLAEPFYRQGSLGVLPAGSFPTGAYPLLTPNKLRESYLDPNPPRSYVMQWNLNVQRELVQRLKLLVAYVGSRGVHLPFQDSDANFVQPTLTPQGYVWPTPRGSGTRLNPNVGQIQALLWNSDSIYHSLQTQVTRDLNHGLQIGGSYTWSKVIDTESSSSAAGVFQNSVRRLFFDARSGRGLADFDVRHNFILNYIWELPVPHTSSSALNWALGGWQWGGIFHASSGVPFTPQIGGDPLGMLSQGTFDFPDRLTGPGCESAINPGNPVNYIRNQCFVFPNPGTRFGNAGRNSLIGPGLQSFDISLFKNIGIRKFSDRFRLQFRFEAFNILNHANFAPPTNANATLFSQAGAAIRTAGLITSTVTTSRQIQLGVKVQW